MRSVITMKVEKNAVTYQRLRVPPASPRSSRRDDRGREREAMILRPGRSEPLAGSVENVVRPRAEDRGGLGFDVLGVEGVHLPATGVRRLGQDLAVHDRV